MLMLEKNGIPTDLIGIEMYIDEVCSEIENHKKLSFLKLAFTPTYVNPIKILEQL